MKDTLEYNGYTSTVTYSTNDEVLYGKIFGINDLVTFEAESIKELKTAFQEAVEDYIVTCKEVGKEPDKVFKGVFNVRIPGELHRDATVIAVRNKVTLNDFVKTAIRYAVNHPQEVEVELSQGI